MNSSNTSRVFIKCYTDTSIYVDLARMTATIHVQCTFKNILSLDINVLKKIERNSNRWGILQNSYTQARKEGSFDFLKIIKFNIITHSLFNFLIPERLSFITSIWRA